VFNVASAVKLAELACGHTRSLHATMLKQQFLRAGVEQKQLAQDLLDFGPRTIHFFSSHFRLAKNASDMTAAALAMRGWMRGRWRGLQGEEAAGEGSTRGKGADLMEGKAEESRRGARRGRQGIS